MEFSKIMIFEKPCKIIRSKKRTYFDKISKIECENFNGKIFINLQKNKYEKNKGGKSK